MTATTATPAELRHVVQAAGLAPSVHNTQPWTFRATACGLELYADSRRRLDVLDPDGRQLHLSCGAALLHARVAARAIALDVHVQLLPDARRPELLADLVLTAGSPATHDEVRLAAAILQRHTFRETFEDRPVPPALIDQLRVDVEREGAGLHHITAEDQLIELEVLLSRADSLEEQNPEYRDELRRWVHDDSTGPDGLSRDALQTSPGSSLRQRDFALTSVVASPTPPPPDRPTVLVLVSADDTPESWLRAGQALGAMLLRAAERGVQAQPLGQVTDVLSYRLGLRGALGTVAVPQLVLRMGFAGRAPITPRRSVEDVLVGVTQSAG